MSLQDWGSATAMVERIARLEERPELKVILRRFSHRVEYSYFVREATGAIEPVIKVGEHWYYAEKEGDEQVPESRVKVQGIVKPEHFDSIVIDETAWETLTESWQAMLSDSLALKTSRADLIIVDGLNVGAMVLAPAWEGRDGNEAGMLPMTVYEAQEVYERYLDEINQEVNRHQVYLDAVAHIDALIAELDARLREEALKAESEGTVILGEA
tara:strand:+ start:129262 stop:129900 length:639 start_codon:yes stop_codon:yes gene_type:complete